MLQISWPTGCVMDGMERYQQTPRFGSLYFRISGARYCIRGIHAHARSGIDRGLQSAGVALCLDTKIRVECGF